MKTCDLISAYTPWPPSIPTLHLPLAIVILLVSVLPPPAVLRSPPRTCPCVGGSSVKPCVSSRISPLRIERQTTTPTQLDEVRLFLYNIDTAFSPGALPLQNTTIRPPCPLLEITLNHISSNQYRAIQHLVDVGLPGSSAAKVSKLNYFAGGILIITFPTQIHETLTGIIEYIRDQMWQQNFYWNAWSDKKDNVVLRKSTSIN